MALATKHDRRIHPGSGRRRGPDHPKGRQVDPAALAEVQALLGERERRRDLLIEHLHLLQDHFGCLHARHLAALAEEMRLALVEVYEVASFYAHFDIVMDGETAPPPITVRVCDSLSCELAGAQQLLTDLETRLGPGVRVVRAPCMGGCDKAPMVAIGHALARARHRRQCRCGRRGGRNASADPGIYRPPQLSRRGRLSPAASLPGGRAHARRGDRGSRAFRSARARRRRVSDRAQMALRATGAGAAAVRGQCATKASPAPSRTAISSKPIRIAFSKAC